MIDTPYERIWFTRKYACGHVTTFPAFRTPEIEQQSRYLEDDYHSCKQCNMREKQEKERYAANPPKNLAIRYIVDGKPMTVEQLKGGYWQGRRMEHGVKIIKYFGKKDPRPLLEEAL